MTDHEKQAKTFSDYWPLVALVGVSFLGALALTWRGFDLMSAFMGIFLLIFALVKLFNISGFVRGFTLYDILAKRAEAYAYVYPFIELCLGLAFLAGIAPTIVAWVTIAVFGFGALGVLMALRDGLDIDCACMGSVLSVPLSVVTLTEDFGMVAMGALIVLGYAS